MRRASLTARTRLDELELPVVYKEVPIRWAMTVHLQR